MSDIFTKEKRSQIMSSVRNRNTDIELILRKAIFAAGFRFRLKTKLFGKPDIVLSKYKIAIFCDGDFWHGKTYAKDKEKYLPFWQEKILKNIRRDKLVNKTLENQGWIVMRFWKSEIKKDVLRCVEQVKQHI